jgi:hypothetical protein
MDDKTLREVLPKHLRFWSRHCTLNAMPSLAIALGWLGLWQSNTAILAMMSAIGSFIILYTVTTSVIRPFANGSGIFTRAFELGINIRAWMSVVGLVAVPTGAGSSSLRISGAVTERP